MAYTNKDIIGAALRGEYAETRTGNFWTEPGGVGPVGWHGSHLVETIRQLAAEGYHVHQVVYSYRTPIAVEFRSPKTHEFVWMVWDVSYSVTTDCRHVSRCWKLSPVTMPRDANVEEIKDLIDRHMVYTRGDRGKPGSYTPGPNPRDTK